MLARGESTYKELCAACHGPDGKGAPMGGATDGTTLAPNLAGVPRAARQRRLHHQGAPLRHDRRARRQELSAAAA